VSQNAYWGKEPDNDSVYGLNQAPFPNGRGHTPAERLKGASRAGQHHFLRPDDELAPALNSEISTASGPSTIILNAFSR